MPSTPQLTVPAGPKVQPDATVPAASTLPVAETVSLPVAEGEVQLAPTQLRPQIRWTAEWDVTAQEETASETLLADLKSTREESKSIRLEEPEATPQQVAAAVRLAESKTADLLRSALVQPMEKVRISEATPLSRSVEESATLLMAEMEGALTPPKVQTRIHWVAQWDLPAETQPADARLEESEVTPLGSAREKIPEARLEEPEA